MKILPLDKELVVYLQKHHLTVKFKKQLKLLELDPRYPSLHNELLEPKEMGIRSFRIDLAYRALFIYEKETDQLEVIDINKHYK